MLSPFERLCGNFILPEPASYVFLHALFNLRKLLYLIDSARRIQSAYGEKFDPLVMFDSKRDVNELLREDAEERAYKREQAPQKRQVRREKNYKTDQER